MRELITIPKDDLIQLYVKEHKSTYEIGKIKYCSHTTVLKNLKRHNIKRRSPSEGIRVKYNIKADELKELLNNNMQNEVAKIYGCSPATICKSIKRFKENGEW